MIKLNNILIAYKLVEYFGGKLLPAKYGLCIWKFGADCYQVRCSENSINSRKPTTFPVNGVVFYLSEYGLLGISDFSKKTLGYKDANMGHLNLAITE